MKKIVQRGLVRAAYIISLSEGYCFYTDINTVVVGWTKKHQITVLLGILGILILIHFVWDEDLNFLKATYEASVNFEALNRLVGLPAAEANPEKRVESERKHDGGTTANT